MKIAAFGRTKIFYDSVLSVCSVGYNPVIIGTCKESPEYSSEEDAFLKLAKKNGADFFFGQNLNDEKIFSQIKHSNADLAISMNWLSVIGKKIIDLFPLGILNLHCGDLPRYRGNACPNWAIINGEKKIGLCVHRMVPDKIDAGDIISRSYFQLDINSKIGDVYKWIESTAPALYLDAVNKIAADKNYVLEKQSEKSEDVLRCYPRLPEDSKIEWNKSNTEILRLINASSEPFSGAFCGYDGNKLIVWRAELYEDDENYCAVQGQVSRIDKNSGDIIVITGSGKLKITEVEFSGKRMKPGNLMNSIRKRLI